MSLDGVEKTVKDVAETRLSGSAFQIWRRQPEKLGCHIYNTSNMAMFTIVEE